MTDKQKIKKLEAQTAELEMKVHMLEARPMIITVQPYVAPWQPAPFQHPYIGDSPYQYPMSGGTVQPLTVGLQTSHNVSSQSSSRIQ